MSEKRSHQRVQKKIKSEVHSTDGMTFSTSLDVSNGGIFISTPEPLKVGEEVELILQIEEKESLSITGVVKWIGDEVKGKKHGMGIEFIKLDEKHRVLLHEILKLK